MFRIDKKVIKMEVFFAVLYGVLAGFAMSTALGVVFFLLIQAGFVGGIKKGLPLALGVISGDILFVILSLKFSEYVQDWLLRYKQVWLLFGSVVFFAIGMMYLFQKQKEVHDESESRIAKMSSWQLWVKAFAINIANPANLTWWIGLFTLPPAIHFDIANKWVFGLSAVASVFFTEVAIAWGAGRVKHKLNTRMMERFHRVFGFVFLILGALMLYQRFAG